MAHQRAIRHFSRESRDRGPDAPNVSLAQPLATVPHRTLPRCRDYVWLALRLHAGATCISDSGHHVGRGAPNDGSPPRGTTGLPCRPLWSRVRNRGCPTGSTDTWSNPGGKEGKIAWRPTEHHPYSEGLGSGNGTDRLHALLAGWLRSSPSFVAAQISGKPLQKHPALTTPRRQIQAA